MGERLGSDHKQGGVQLEVELHSVTQTSLRLYSTRNILQYVHTYTVCSVHRGQQLRYIVLHEFIQARYFRRLSKKQTSAERGKVITREQENAHCNKRKEFTRGITD